MDKKIDIQLQIDPKLDMPKVIVCANEESKLTQDIIAAINNAVAKDLAQIKVYKDGEVVLINQRDIIRCYTEDRRIIIASSQGTFTAKYTLRELEELLDSNSFVRISRFEIINLNKTSGFDFNMAGTIKVTFDDKSTAWVARRYVRTITQVLDRM